MSVCVYIYTEMITFDCDDGLAYMVNASSSHNLYYIDLFVCVVGCEIESCEISNSTRYDFYIYLIKKHRLLYSSKYGFNVISHLLYIITNSVALQCFVISSKLYISSLIASSERTNNHVFNEPSTL
jgi:hypothetical protein